MSRKPKPEASAEGSDALLAIRWIPEASGVYPRQDIANNRDLVLTHGAVVGVGEPLGEGAPATSEQFAKDLIEAGHAEPCEIPPAEKTAADDAEKLAAEISEATHTLVLDPDE